MIWSFLTLLRWNLFRQPNLYSNWLFQSQQDRDLTEILQISNEIQLLIQIVASQVQRNTDLHSEQQFLWV